MVVDSFVAYYLCAAQHYHLQFQALGSMFFNSYGSGSRITLAHSRKIIDAIHFSTRLNANYKKTAVFRLDIPTEIEGVPSEIQDPVNTWSDKDAYNDTFLKLGGLFKKKFEVFANYKIRQDNKLREEILAAGPIL